MGIVSKSLGDCVRNFEVAQGEIDNVLEAAVRDIGEAGLEHMRANWPVDTGFSLSRWTFHQTGLRGVIRNDADYAGFVHHGLADRLWDDVERVIAKDATALLSERVVNLLARGRK